MMTFIIVGVVVAGIYVAVAKPNKKQASSLLACTSCGSFMNVSGAPGDIARCADCGGFSQVGATNDLVAVPSDHVAERHVFEAYLPEGPHWPSVCCVCGVPATRTERMQVQYTVGMNADDQLAAIVSGGTVGGGPTRVTEKYAVPHCDAHQGGAVVSKDGVAFRSYGYHRQFIALNRRIVGN